MTENSESSISNRPLPEIGLIHVSVPNKRLTILRVIAY